MVEGGVEIYSGLGLGNKPVHCSIGPDTGSPGDGLAKVVINRGPRHALYPLQLPSCWKVKPLAKEEEYNMKVLLSNKLFLRRVTFLLQILNTMFKIVVN